MLIKWLKNRNNIKIKMTEFFVLNPGTYKAFVLATDSIQIVKKNKKTGLMEITHTDGKKYPLKPGVFKVN